MLGLGLGLNKGNFAKMIAKIYIMIGNEVYVTTDNFIYMSRR